MAAGDVEVGVVNPIAINSAKFNGGTNYIDISANGLRFNTSTFCAKCYFENVSVNNLFGNSVSFRNYFRLTDASKFHFEDTDNNVITGVPTLNWGGNQIGGIYSETIQGLHKDNVMIEGTFILNKVCAVEALTTH